MIGADPRQKEAQMHAVTVKVSIDDPERAERELREQVVPMVSQAPGFVAGYWLEPQDGKGASFVVFDSEEHANAMVEGIRAQQAQGNMPVTFDEVSARGVLIGA
jgi:heme-degrading monooxygenase HmoA